jgi:hypothetical protein
MDLRLRRVASTGQLQIPCNADDSVGDKAKDGLMENSDGRWASHTECYSSSEAAYDMDTDSCLSKASTPVMHNSPERAPLRTSGAARALYTLGEAMREDSGHKMERSGGPNAERPGSSVPRDRIMALKASRRCETEGSVVRSARGAGARTVLAGSPRADTSSARRVGMCNLETSGVLQAEVWDAIKPTSKHKQSDKSEARVSNLKDMVEGEGGTSANTVKRRSNVGGKSRGHSASTAEEACSMESWLMHIAKSDRRRVLVSMQALHQVHTHGVCPLEFPENQFAWLHTTTFE